MIGWISLHRKVRDHWLFEEKRSFSRFEAWVDLLMEVNHQDNKVLLGNELIDVKRGQKITSMDQLAKRWGWGKTKTYKFVKLLESEQMITIKTNTKRTVITIVNYDFYQVSETQKRTPREHQENAKRTPPDTNNNVNNVNNVNNDYNNAISNNDDVFDFYQNNFGVISSHTSEELLYWIEDLNEELVLEALKRTNDQKKQWSYAKAILSNWLNNNIKSIDDVYAADTEFQNRKSNRQGSTRRIIENKEDEELGW
ncbi:DnaD domain-containing protein [Bacillus sp. AFS017336]|uniref:DnaD domain-containing protein n=1 Tax=Bacillus sp. AFS017336 TaxID=2033489 RepID=UPI000BF08B64|nr:DnaD domain protein [Bacillus sp. AFS017336]PEL12689.1 hypothetical protein CN601_07005 [Bacillus sp. AFS017336]